MTNAHYGGDFDDFLRGQGLFEDAEAVAAERVIAHQIAQEMRRAHLTKSEMAPRARRLSGQHSGLLAPSPIPEAMSEPTTPPRSDRHHYHGPPTWVPVSIAVVVIAAVQMLLPRSVTWGPLWLIPAIELVGVPIIIVVWYVAQDEKSRLPDRLLDGAMTAYLCFLAAASALNAALLLTTLLVDVDDSAPRLLFAGFAVLGINVLTFALIYWWLDGGGPRVRAMGEVQAWDFQYPQQASGQSDWTPLLSDYLYTAYTNLVAFSPTDTMPLTRRVKLLFTLQSAISLVTILVTVSRAINMLPMGK